MTLFHTWKLRRTIIIVSLDIKVLQISDLERGSSWHAIPGEQEAKINIIVAPSV